jgi:hypothetical protein
MVWNMAMQRWCGFGWLAPKTRAATAMLPTRRPLWTLKTLQPRHPKRQSRVGLSRVELVSRVEFGMPRRRQYNGTAGLARVGLADAQGACYAWPT